ncbi:phosphatidate cytidylyltransferase [Marinobacteraceae bacterium S3BR75-40.1]
MLKQRIITALILAPIAIGGIFFLPPNGFAVFIGAILAIAAWEWGNLSGFEGQPMRVGYALVIAALIAWVTWAPALAALWLAVVFWAMVLFLVKAYPTGTQLWQAPMVRLAMGVPVLVGAYVGLHHLRTADVVLGRLDSNLVLILYSFAIVWAADIGAYFSGRAWGKRKLAPQVSPGKSWAGVYGGLVSVLLLSLLVGWWIEVQARDLLVLVIVTQITAVVSVYGDLFESMLKRHRGIKDSSALLPGHGGVLDRVDSLTAAVPVFAFCASLAGWLH